MGLNSVAACVNVTSVACAPKKPADGATGTTGDEPTDAATDASGPDQKDHAEATEKTRGDDVARSDDGSKT